MAQESEPDVNSKSGICTTRQLIYLSVILVYLVLIGQSILKKPIELGASYHESDVHLPSFLSLAPSSLESRPMKGFQYKLPF